MDQSPARETARPRGSTGTRRLLMVTAAMLAVLVYPILFWFGLYRWWDDPPGEAWAALVVTAIVGASLALAIVVGVASTMSWQEVPSLGRLVGSAAVFAIGLPLAAVVGVFAALTGFSCSGGVIGEGCSGGSPLFGIVVGGLVLACTVGVAWHIDRPRS